MVATINPKPANKNSVKIIMEIAEQNEMPKQQYPCRLISLFIAIDGGRIMDGLLDWFGIIPNGAGAKFVCGGGGGENNALFLWCGRLNIGGCIGEG